MVKTIKCYAEYILPEKTVFSNIYVSSEMTEYQENASLFYVASSVVTSEINFLSSAMSRIINTFKWIGKNPKKSLFLFVTGSYVADYCNDKYT